MVRLAASIQAESPWMGALRTPYHKGLIEALKLLPGCRWRPDDKAWLVPSELWSDVRGIGQRFGLAIELPRPEKTGRFFPPSLNCNPSLHDYQRDSVARTLSQEALLCSYEMGLGKSAVGVTLARNGALPALVLCPASVRLQWAREFSKWAPGLSVGVWASALQELGSDVTVCSYQLAEQLAGYDWGTLILDECHYIKNPKAKRSQLVAELARRCDYRLGLTGTPIGNEPVDLWHQLEVLFPGRFGTFYKFASTYAQVIHSEYGTAFRGLNLENSPALNRRLSHCSHRVTKAQVADKLPPLMLSTVFLPLKEGASLDSRIPHAAELIQNSGAQRVCVLTHYRETAERLAASLGYVCITGELPNAKRDALLRETTSRDEWGIVATMASVGTGVDTLAQAQYALFVELDFSPELLTQAVGRFARLSSREPTTVHLAIIPGSREEETALRVEAKMLDIAALIPNGQADLALKSALGVEDPHFSERMSRIGEDYLGL